MKAEEIIKILTTYEKILEDENQEITNHYLHIIIIKLVKIVKEMVIEREKYNDLYR